MPPAAAPTVTIARVEGTDFAHVPDIRLRVSTPSGVTDHRLGLTAISIGSSSDCDLVVADASVSRRHCQIQLDEKGLLVRDLGSRNGTFVDRTRIIEALLAPNQTVLLGESRIELLSGSDPRTVELASSAHFGAAIGSSVAMRALFAMLEKAASHDAPLLLLGESGTGKDVLAHALHDHSRRKAKPFVVFDCGGVAGELIESELFGHVKGAFSGAEAARLGLWQQADGGTLFLDEVGELPLELQPRLLRALESQEVRPVGGNSSVKTDVRVIAGTHRNLAQRVKEGAFRADLYHRIAVLELTVPPLRDRPGDIPLLVQHFLSQMDPPVPLSSLPLGTLKLLQGHSWPGNLRELRNAVTRLVLGLDFSEVGGVTTQALKQTTDAIRRLLPLKEARELIMSEFEPAFIAAHLEAAGGNVSAAARAMGISRTLLYRMMGRSEEPGSDDDVTASGKVG